MKITMRIPRQVYQTMMADLARPHEFAFERVGFCRVKLGSRGQDTQYVMISGYWPVPDEHYIPDDYAGARINRQAIRNALQTSLSTGDGIFHVHMHDHAGEPGFSWMDRQEITRIVESLSCANAAMPHGMLLLSHDMASADTIMPNSEMQTVDRITVVGQPTLLMSRLPAFYDEERFSRQTFLGPLAPKRINSLWIGIVGLSGGGSHIAQQLTHTGFANYSVFDSQPIDLSNLNRLVGGTEEDVREGRLKVAIANRVITSINSAAKIKAIAARWQDHPEALRGCDVVIGCVDGFDERRQLEAACRRYLIPLIDIGMDVTVIEPYPPRMAGQVILSLPGSPCFHCIGFLNEKTLAAEAQNYGDAGINPQVVWPNGSLASTAVGIAVDLATGWTRTAPGLIYKSYDGNTYEVSNHPRYEHVWNKQCNHYRLDSIGDP